MGTMLFYLLWPLVWFYAPLTIRVRAVLLYEDEVLVVKNWFGPNSWQLPGGGHKRGETVIETAIREIKEELSIELDVKQCRQLNDEPIVKSKSGLLMRYYLVEVVLDNKPSITANKEITDHEWKTVSSVSDLIPAQNQ